MGASATRIARRLHRGFLRAEVTLAVEVALQLDVPHVEQWLEGIGALINAKDYSPTTCNGWAAVLGVT